MEIKYTNFDGNWDENCPFCGTPQKTHKKDLGILEGVRYIRRQPCSEEQHQVSKNAVKRGIALRTIILIYDFFNYLWGLIPFKEEIQLLWKTIKYVFISLRAILYLNKNKPKKHNK